MSEATTKRPTGVRLEFPPDAYRQIKVAAVMAGVPMKKFAEDAVLAAARGILAAPATSAALVIAAALEAVAPGTTAPTAPIAPTATKGDGE